MGPCLIAMGRYGPLGVGLRDAPPRGLMQRGSQWLAANYTMSSLRTETLKIYDSDALRCSAFCKVD